jgi:hypothetical protein
MVGTVGIVGTEEFRRNSVKEQRGSIALISVHSPTDLTRNVRKNVKKTILAKGPQMYSSITTHCINSHNISERNVPEVVTYNGNRQVKDDVKLTARCSGPTY